MVDGDRKTMTAENKVARSGPQHERIGYLDLLRGVALLGILMANVRQMFLPWSVSDLPVALGGSAAVSWIDWGIFQVLVDQKFLTLFSLLFGASFALQWDRLSAREGPAKAIYLRRLLILALLGAVHGVVLYPAEVLLPYACIGLILFAMRRLSADTLIRNGLALWSLTVLWGYQISTLSSVSLLTTALTALAIIIVAVSVWHRSRRAALIAWTLIVVVACTALTLRAGLPIEESSLAADFNRGQQTIAAMQSGDSEQWPDALATRRLGSFADLIALNVEYYSFILFYFGVLLLWRTLALFMIGAGLMRLQAMQYWANRPVCLRHCLLGTGIGLSMSLLAALLAAAEMNGHSDLRWTSVMHVLAVLPLALGLAAGVYLWRAHNANGIVLKRVEAAGRMALSNYVAQSLVMVALAEPWGLDGYGRWGGAALSVLAVLVFAVLATGSHSWLQRYRMGPLEWLWRCGSYWQWLPNRR